MVDQLYMVHHLDDMVYIQDQDYKEVEVMAQDMLCR